MTCRPVAPDYTDSCFEEMIVKKIVGIVLVKNEDIFISRVLLNILHFCDEIIVADNASTDETAEKIQQLSRQHHKIQYHRITTISVSHDLIQGYAGRDVWVFGVDGDEIYDPRGLQSLREQLLAGAYEDWWLIFGNVLHCVALNRDEKTARGHFAPPCRSMTKLYNFAMIESWKSSSGERLHGGEVIFKKGFGPERRFELYKEVPWEESLFRCLHMCFLQRSSIQRSWRGKYVPRPNPADILSRTYLQQSWSLLRKLCGLPVAGKQEWKVDKFTRGPMVSCDVADFFKGDVLS